MVVGSHPGTGRGLRRAEAPGESGGARQSHSCLLVFSKTLSRGLCGIKTQGGLAMITVVNKRHHRGGGVYIGRPSLLGNPFRIGEHGTREEVIAKYRVWLWRQIQRRGSVYRELLCLADAAL